MPTNASDNANANPKANSKANSKANANANAIRFDLANRGKMNDRDLMLFDLHAKHACLQSSSPPINWITNPAIALSSLFQPLTATRHAILSTRCIQASPETRPAVTGNRSGKVTHLTACNMLLGDRSFDQANLLTEPRM